MSTYRERREAKAERLRGWAEQRQQRAAQVFEANRPYTSDIAFNTQPGSFPLRRRVIRQEDRAYESLRKAEEMQRRAAGIEAAAAGAIYSDDPDAIAALEARIAGLEAERDRIKAFNASARRGAPDESLLDPSQRASLASVRRYASFQLAKGGGMPAYALSNLSGNIKRNRDRLEELRRRGGQSRTRGKRSEPHRIRCRRCGRILVVTSATVKQRMDAHDRTHARGQARQRDHAAAPHQHVHR